MRLQEQVVKFAPGYNHRFLELTGQLGAQLVIDEGSFWNVTLVADECRSFSLQYIHLVQNTKEAQNFGMRSIFR